MALAEALPTFERFEVVERIGAGAFADVYKAYDRHNARTVALKVISPHLTTDPISLERFRREVQITRHIGHPSIVPIFEVYEENGRPILVMEYIEGEELKQFVDTRPPIPFDVVAYILQQLLEALQSCHQKDVIHRDLKPQNILVTEDHRIRVLDFGVAKMMQLTDLTKSGTTLGTPEYAAPEVYSSSLYDPRSDLYSIGVIGFELISGQLPFQANSVAELLNQQLHAEVPSLSTLRAGTPEWFEKFIARLMARHSFERYQSCEEALRDLARQSVVADSEFTLPQRNCLSCHRSSPEALSICLHCGYDLSSSEGSAVYDLVYSKGSSQEGLREFAEERFGRTVSHPDKTRVLIGGLSENQATLLRDQAGASGLLLETRKLNPVLHFLSTFVPALAGGYFLAYALSGYLTIGLLSQIPAGGATYVVLAVVVNTSIYLALGTCLSALVLSSLAEDSTQHDSTMRGKLKKAIARLCDLPGLKRLLRLPALLVAILLAGFVFVVNVISFVVLLAIVPKPLQALASVPVAVLLVLAESLACFCAGLHILVKQPRLRDRLYRMAEERRNTLRHWCGPLFDRMSWLMTILFIILVPYVLGTIAFFINRELGLMTGYMFYPLVLICVLAHRASRSLDPPLLPALRVGSTRLHRISRRIRPYITAEQSPELRSALVAIVKKIVAMDRVLTHEHADADLEHIAFFAARVTHKASQVRRLAPNRDVHHALAAFQHLASKASRSNDPTLVESQLAIETQLTEYMRIEEGLSRLYLQMIRLNASLDQLALQELRTNTEVSDTLCRSLRSRLEEMEGEIQVFLDAKSDLERAALA